MSFTRPLILDMLFNDDRKFVLEIWPPPMEKADQGWTIVTRRNVPDYPLHRVDSFPNESEAIDYYKKIVVTTPRASFEGKLQPESTLEEYKAWLIAENLFDPILNPEVHRPEGVQVWRPIVESID